MRKLFLLALAATATLSSQAGGLVTNTNQNAAFLRQLSQEAIIDITGLYMNPAGTAFLTPGAHVSFNIQNAKQKRTIDTTFPLFALNMKNHSAMHTFEGKADAPVVPSVQYSYNWEKWSINANFALGGGGGKCEFDQGLGSFESLYASQIPEGIKMKMTSMVAAGIVAQSGGTVTPEMADMLAKTGNYEAMLNGYSMNSYMKGRQYYFGLSVGSTYKITDDLAVFGGLRVVYSTNNYNGYAEDITAKYVASYEVPAVGIAKTPVSGEQELSESAMTLNADQKGWGFTPMLGIDWRINDQWNVAAKYEFKTRLRLENKSEMNNFAKEQAEKTPVIGQFKDGSTIAADIPAFFCAGVQYKPIAALRLQAGYHWYGDKSATQFGNKQDLIDNDTWEVTAGVEYDICKWVTLSGGWQTTNYGLSDAYMNDLSFTTSSKSWGVGARVNISERWNIDLGFMQTLYKERTVDTVASTTPLLVKTDTYTRTNRVLGLGLNFNF